MLPDDAETWGFNLVNMFWTALTNALKGFLLDSGYVQPPYKAITIQQSQKQALTTLHAHATKYYLVLQHQELTMVTSLKSLITNKTHSFSKTFLKALTDATHAQLLPILQSLPHFSNHLPSALSPPNYHA